MMLPLLTAFLMSNPSIEPLAPIPVPRQVAWQKMGQYAFIHFGPNTFTGREWGEGRENPQVFAPTAFDARQWAKSAKAGGFTGIILTAKHHDGFCLWPSKYSTHTVAQSGFKTDVVKAVSEACKAEGLKFGIYLSPWDRNHPTYGTPEYNQVFANMLSEVLTQYGQVFEVWFDGANGEGPNGKKQVYDWNLFISTVRKHQPNAVIFSDAGPDVRWVGNEEGIADATSWSTIDRDRYVPGTPFYKELTQGKPKGTHWLPSECDVSIRPGWFYHADQDNRVKTPEQLLSLWEQSVGMNSNFLLNLPPDRRGLIHEKDVESLKGFAALRKATYGKDLAKGALAGASQHREGYDAKNLTDGRDSTYWAAPSGVVKTDLTVTLKKPTAIDRVELREPIELGQRVSAFRLEARVGSRWYDIGKGTTIGNRRIVPVEPIRAEAVRVRIDDALAAPVISSLSLYATPETQKPSLETKQERDQRMAWWREARFGMFIHWGLYAIAAGSWNGKPVPSAGEWIMNTGQITRKDYEPLADQWNPTKFDAREWVRIAKDAGMKYIVITSKHHDGFGLWPSAEGDWNVKRSPSKRDVLKELAAACKEAGVKLCFYHSIMDWRHPDYLPRRSWDKDGEAKANFDRYVKYMKAQLKELLTNYGDIGLLWFDGEWEGTWTHERGKDLYQFVRSIQPKLIVNNRVDKGRAGMQGMTQGNFAGDYGTPEQEIPANGIPGIDWESCMTMNDTWGWKTSDLNWKSSTNLIRNLIDCASKGGNYLLNVGPTPEGLIPSASVERLADMGRWMKTYGDTIYGSSASPFPRPLPWGRVTQKGNRLYLHVYSGDQIVLPGLSTDIVEVKDYATGKPVKFTQSAQGVEVDLIGVARNPHATVLTLTFRGALKVVPVLPKQNQDGFLDLVADEATVKGSARLEDDKHAIGYWVDPKDTVSWTFDAQRGEVDVEIEYACDPGSAGSTFQIEVGGQTLKGKVESTGGWGTFKRFKVGRVALVVPGKTELVVRPLSKPGEGVMNLRSIRFRRP